MDPGGGPWRRSLAEVPGGGPWRWTLAVDPTTSTGANTGATSTGATSTGEEINTNKTCALFPDRLYFTRSQH